MSASLLQKSLKLFEEKSLKSKKGSRRNIQKLGKKKNQVILQHLQKGELKQQKVEENIKKLQFLNTYSVSTDVSKKILEHTVKGSKPLDLKPRKIEPTVFTEEDFAKFEEEYVVDN